MATQSRSSRRAPSGTGKKGGAVAAGAHRPAPRPLGPGTTEPPVPMTDDLDPSMAPPLPGKTHPPAEMDDATPTLDDEARLYPHHPSDAGATAFGFDPDAADAAADLAGDFGTTFLSGATRGEDVSDLAMSAGERDENDLPFVIDTESEQPAPQRRRRKR